MKKPYIIGITGGSGSGKTTFLHQLTKIFSREELCIVSQDDYYRPRMEQYVDENGIQNFDLPDSIDHKSFVQDIQRLIEGETISRQEYVFNNALTTPKTLTFEPAPLLILEGLFIFHIKELQALLDLKVFIHAKEDLKIIRRIKRDRVERNYPLEDVLYRYEHHVSPTFKQYILPYKEDADIVINNNESFDEAFRVFIGFLKYKLMNLDQAGD